MDAVALILVLAGACCHAAWNILAKKAVGGAAFVWLYGLVSCLFAAPFALYAGRDGALPGAAVWLAIVASAALHVGYSLVLQRAYRLGDFSLVYPLARGSGPLFAVLGAVVLLGEMPSLLGWVGIAAVVAGIFALAGPPQGLRRADERLRQGLAWGALTGLSIAAYTVVDGAAIRALGASPILFYFFALVLRTVILAPWALRDRAALGRQWRQHRTAIVAVGVLSPLAYTLVLFALTRAPLTYVAPAREVSMLIGATLGARLFGEGRRRARLLGTAFMVAGVVALALAR